MRTPSFVASHVHERAAYARQLCEIVACLNSRGLVLVDFKPSHVMMKRGDDARPWFRDPWMKVVGADSWRRAGGPICALTNGGPLVPPEVTPVFAAMEVRAPCHH